MSKLVQYKCNNFPNLIGASHDEGIQTFQNGVNSSTKTLKAFGNTLELFLSLISSVSMPYNDLHHFPLSSLFWF
jgi:hypothetical protein